MSFVYISHGIVIYPHRHILEHSGKEVRVRPKTFALLLALVDRPREILTKRCLLDTIWDDVAVDEQVLVQSIREIRQLFGSPEVIKTYPRKGYSWVVDVQKKPLEAPGSPPPQPSSHRNWFYLIPLCLLILLASAIYAVNRGVAWPSNNGSAKNLAVTNTSLGGPVMILPVKTRIPGIDHKWVYLGAMDQLIQLLATDDKALVMDTEYVLNAMGHAKMPRDYSSEQVARMFQVSGGSLVVESELSGSVEEYRLDYKLHFKNDIKRGAIFAKTIDALLAKLGQTIAQYTGQDLHNAHAERPNEFTSELMARALEHRDVGELEVAQGLLSSLIQLESDNLVARRLLAQVLVQRQQPELAEKELRTAIKISLALNSKESARLHYWLATAQLNQHSADTALATLDRADALARDNNDHLYQAYIAQLRGQILQQLGQLDEAGTALYDALKYHGIIRCPIGEAQTQLQLASLLTSQGRQAMADDFYSRAKKLIETHQLHALQSSLDNH